MKLTSTYYDIAVKCWLFFLVGISVIYSVLFISLHFLNVGGPFLGDK